MVSVILGFCCFCLIICCIFYNLQIKLLEQKIHRTDSEKCSLETENKIIKSRLKEAKEKLHQHNIEDFYNSYYEYKLLKYNCD